MSFLIAIFSVSMCDVRYHSWNLSHGDVLKGFFHQPFGRESIEKRGFISNTNVILLTGVVLEGHRDLW